METRVLAPTDDAVALAARTLRSGGLVAIPTETVYGLAGSALDEHAVAAIFAAKDRPTFDPLIVHMGPPPGWHGASPAERFERAAGGHVFDSRPLSRTGRDRVGRLMAAFWPGPLTLVLPRAGRIPLLVTSGLESVAVRMPHHPLAQAVLARAGVPLAAPSANRFGRISPTTAADVVAELGGRIGLVLDGGPCPVGVESTIVRIDPDGGLELLRPGGLAAERIAEIAGVAPRPVEAGPDDRIVAPGTLESHYAPATPLLLLPGPAGGLDRLPESIERRLRDLRGGIGLLVFSGDPAPAVSRISGWSGRPVLAEVLSRSGDVEEAARGLFGALRALDAAPVAMILAEPCPTERGLGHAIADRLRRAASP